MSDFRGADWPDLEYEGIDPTELFPEGTPGSGHPDDAADSTISFAEGLPGTPSVFSDEQTSAKFYNYYEIVTRVQFETGLKGAPKAGAKGTGETAIWRANGGWAMLTVAWLAERLGSMPVLPHFDFGDPEYVLQGGEIIPESPTPTPNGETFCYRVRGHYIYWMQRWDITSFYWPVATTRAVRTPSTEFRIGPAEFDRDLLRFLTNVSPPPVTF